MTIHPTGAFEALIPEDVRENVRQHRTFAELVADLGAEHEANVARIDALLAETEAHDAR